MEGVIDSSSKGSEDLEEEAEHSSVSVFVRVGETLTLAAVRRRSAVRWPRSCRVRTFEVLGSGVRDVSG